MSEAFNRLAPFHVLPRLYTPSQTIEASKVDKTDKPFSEMKIISIDIS